MYFIQLGICQLPFLTSTVAMISVAKADIIYEHPRELTCVGLKMITFLKYLTYSFLHIQSDAEFAQLFLQPITPGQ